MRFLLEWFNSWILKVQNAKTKIILFAVMPTARNGIGCT